MKRRRALELITAMSAGAILVGGCDFTRPPILKNLKVEKSTYKSLGKLSHRILPIPEDMVLENVSPSHFLLRMIDDCERPEEIEAFVYGMETFFDSVKNEGKVDELTDEFLKSKMQSEVEGDEQSISYFLNKVKGYNVEYYRGLEQYLTKYTDWEFIPGRFHGCVNV